MNARRTAGRWARSRAERILFTISLAGLFALSAWWSVGMTRWVEQGYEAKIAQLSPADRVAGSPALEAVDLWRMRRRVMVYGEGSLLLLLLLICTYMLYRLAVEQRRFREQQEAFVGQATHEMKTPLAGLRALLQTVALGRMPPEALAEAVDLGLRQIDRQERLIQNMLLGHRARYASDSFRMVPTALDEVVDLLLRERSGVGARGVAFHRIGGDGVMAEADAEALTTILENLFENAVRYGAKQVTVTIEPENDEVSVVVEDDGDGFGPEAAEEIFRPFRRVAGVETKGTGLGLPLSRTLAQRMGGFLRGESDGPGQGARFHLQLKASSEDGR